MSLDCANDEAKMEISIALAVIIVSDDTAGFSAYDDKGGRERVECVTVISCPVRCCEVTG